MATNVHTIATLGVLLLAAPHAIPALSVPSSDQMNDMEQMPS